MQRGRPRTFQPAKALEDMLLVFWKRGFAATSMQDLEQATGLYRTSLYQTFSDKQGIYIAALRLYSQRYLVPPAAGSSLQARLTEHALRGLNEGGGPWGCMLTQMAYDQELSRLEALGLRKQLNDALQRSILATLQKARADEDQNINSTDIESITTHIMSLRSGLSTSLRLGHAMDVLETIARSYIDALLMPRTQPYGAILLSGAQGHTV